MFGRLKAISGEFVPLAALESVGRLTLNILGCKSLLRDFIPNLEFIAPIADHQRTCIKLKHKNNSANTLM